MGEAVAESSPRSPPAMDVEVHEASAGQFVVVGSLTFPSARHAAERGIRAFAASSASALQADLAGVRTADSAGLAVLVNWLAWAYANQRKLTFSHVPASIVDLARISEAATILGC